MTLSALQFWSMIGAVWQVLKSVLVFLQTYKDAIAIIALVPAATWTLLIYRRSKKKESAEWLRNLFTSFYLSDDFHPIRTSIEFDSETKVRPLIERVLVDENVDVTGDEKRRLCDIDTLLNYFEFILYLEKSGQIKRADCEAMFEHWFGLLQKPEYAYLRFYCHRFGYESICRMISRAKSCSDLREHVAFYGSLMTGVGQKESLIIKDKLEPRGQCQILGDLYDLGNYPGLVPGGSLISAELYAVVDQSIFNALDNYEEFDVRDMKGSLFIRRAVRLANPAVDSWVYFYNRDVSNQPSIAKNSWVEHTRHRSRA